MLRERKEVIEDDNSPSKDMMGSYGGEQYLRQGTFLGGGLFPLGLYSM